MATPLMRVEPTELSAGTQQELRVINGVADRAVAWQIKAAPGALRAVHTFAPVHEGFLAPLQSVLLKVTLDDTVNPDAQHKDKLLLVAVALETGATAGALEAIASSRTVADFLGSASHRVFKLKIPVSHERQPAAAPLAAGVDDEEEDAAKSVLPVEEVPDLEPRTVVEHILQHSPGAPTSGLPCKTLFATFFGSRAYNLTLDPTVCDTDVYGVFVAPLKDILSVRSHMTAPPFEESVVGQRAVICKARVEELDFTIRELSNFCTLLVLGSPNVVEMLFVDAGVCYASDAWWRLTALRDRFITRRFALNYLGWASAALHTLKRMKVMKLRRKAVCHAMRIVATARNVITNSSGPRLIIEGPLRDTILSIKRGVRDGELDGLVAQVRSDIAAAELLVATSPLPEMVSNETIALLNDFVFATRTAEVVAVPTP